MRCWLVLFLILLHGASASVGGQDKSKEAKSGEDKSAATAKLPTVVLYGDSIRLSYAPAVAKQLEGQATIVSLPSNGGDSANVLKKIEEWAIQPQPDVIHFNCGIHDTKKFKKTGKFQVSPEEYEKNLRAIVARLRKDTKAKIFFALTTPIIDERAATTRADRDYELLNASTEQYNEIAKRVMKELDVPVNDLRTPLGSAEEYGKLLVDDGTHFNKQGVAKLAATVTEFLQKELPAGKEASPGKAANK